MKTIELLKAEAIGIRDLRSHLSKIIGKKKTYLITNRGEQKMFLIPYEDVIEMVEILEESKDDFLKEQIRRAREEYRKEGGTPFEGG